MASSATTRKAHILVVGGKWPPETFIARRLVGLAAAGFRVTLAVKRSRVKAELPGVRIKSLPAPERAPFTSIFQLARHTVSGLVMSPRRVARMWRALSSHKGRRWLWKLMEILPFVAERPDCLHFEWNFAAADYIELFDVMDCPAVVSCRGTQVLVAPHDPRRAREASLIGLSFEKAAAIHCVSEAVARKAVELGAPREKIRTFRPAVDTVRFSPGPRSADSREAGFRILMTCTLSWVKGYEYALSALRILRDSGVDARLVIAGGADKINRQRLLYTIEDLGIHEWVRLPGPLSPDQVIAELRSADAYLLSSVSEGISNSVLEAMSCGVAVVSTKCPGMEEVITDGVDGFLAPQREPKAMAACLARLAQSRELRETVGRAARRRMVEAFDHDRLVAQWSGLYRELCGLGSPLPRSERKNPLPERRGSREGGRLLQER